RRSPRRRSERHSRISRPLAARRNPTGSAAACAGETGHLRTARTARRCVRAYWALALLARSPRIPLALFLHIQKISRLTAPLFPWLARRFILPSEYLRNWAVKNRGTPPRRTGVLYNPIDVDRFRPDAARREAARRRFGFTPDDVVVGFAGGSERQKAVLSLA